MKRSEAVLDYEDFEVDKVRSKRDYYDELTESTTTKTADGSGEKKGSEDYYGTLDEGVPTKAPVVNPLRDCVNLLGIRG